MMTFSDNSYVRRDTSAPMDIDKPDRPSWLDAPSSQQYDAPRKRPHIDIQTPLTPSRTDPFTQITHVTPSARFLFHSAPRPDSTTGFIPQPPNTYLPFPPHTPGATHFHLGSSVSFGRRVESEDVDMTSDSPARPTTARVVDPVEEPGKTDMQQDELVMAEVKPELVEKPQVQAIEQQVAQVQVEERPIASGAVSRVRKKRQQQDWRARRRGSYSEDEGSQQRHSGQQLANHTSRSEHQHHYNFHVPTPALRHSEIPSLLLAYLQFFVNAAIVVFVLYLAVQLVLTVRRDVQDRMQEVSMEILQEIAECSTLYLTNRCEPGLRVPAMEAPCRAWETCMNRDPTFVGRSNVMAETFAGVINTFVETISWKTMAFTLVTLSFLVILTNSALWNLRSKVLSSEPIRQHQVPGPFPPPQFMQPQVGMGVGHNQGIQFGGGDQLGVGQIAWNDEKKEKKGWW